MPRIRVVDSGHSLGYNERGFLKIKGKPISKISRGSTGIIHKGWLKKLSRGRK